MDLDTDLPFNRQRSGDSSGHFQTLRRAWRCALALALGLMLSVQGCESSHSSVPKQADVAATLPQRIATARVVDGNASALAAANRAFHEDRVVAPAGDNALEHTLRALQEDTNHAGAVEMLVDIAPMAAAAIEANISAGNFVEAERVIGLLASANPDSLTVRGLQRRFELATRPNDEELMVMKTSPGVGAAVEAEATAAGDAVTLKRRVLKTESKPNRAMIAASSQPPSEITVATLAEKKSGQDRPALMAVPARAANVFSEPIPTFRAKPVYPLAAKKRRAEGWVELQFTVGIDGTARQVEVLQSEPPGMFDRSAVQALARWKFKPAVRDGHPIEARAKTKVGFKLG